VAPNNKAGDALIAAPLARDSGCNKCLCIPGKQRAMRVKIWIITASALLLSSSIAIARLEQPGNRCDAPRATNPACCDGDESAFCRLAELRSHWPELRRWQW